VYNGVILPTYVILPTFGQNDICHFVHHLSMSFYPTQRWVETFTYHNTKISGMH